MSHHLPTNTNIVFHSLIGSNPRLVFLSVNRCDSAKFFIVPSLPASSLLIVVHS